MVNYNSMLILHGYGDMELQMFLGHDLDLLGSRDVIDHVVIELATYGDPLKPPLYLSQLLRYCVSNIWPRIFH